MESESVGNYHPEVRPRTDAHSSQEFLPGESSEGESYEAMATPWCRVEHEGSLDMTGRAVPNMFPLLPSSPIVSGEFSALGQQILWLLLLLASYYAYFTN